MEKKLLIFDLDGTLFDTDFSCQEEIFRRHFGSNQSMDVYKDIGEILGEYEKKFLTYDFSKLSDYLTSKTGVYVPEEFIHEWNDVLYKNNLKLNDGVISTLDYLRDKGYFLRFLTNWFSECQLKRLQDANIIDYFDLILCGEQTTKPNKESYYLAAQGFDPNDCLVIGDDLERDFLGPKTAGFDAILFDKTNKSGYRCINKFDDLKRRF